MVEETKKTDGTNRSVYQQVDEKPAEADSAKKEKAVSKMPRRTAMPCRESGIDRLKAFSRQSKVFTGQRWLKLWI
jgi:hypothetical protein